MKRKDFSDLKIDVQDEKELYFEHEDYIAGVAPFLRGTDTTMYLQKPLKTVITIEHNSPLEANAFIKEKINKGYTNFSINFDSKGLNQQNTGLKIKTVDEMKILFNDIPLNKIKVNFKCSNNSALPFLIYYLIAAKEAGFNNKDLFISLENNINTPSSETTIPAIIDFAKKQLPNFSLINSGNNLVTPKEELAHLVYESYKQISNSILNGITVDAIAPKILFKWKPENNLVFEVSKMRAARMLWAKMIQQFQPKNQKSLALQIHIESDNFINTFASILGGAQYVYATNLISEFIKKETSISKTVDPLAGSTSIEKATEEIAIKNWNSFLKMKKTEKITNATNNIDFNFIVSALEAAEKRITLEGIFKILKIEQ